MRCSAAKGTWRLLPPCQFCLGLQRQRVAGDRSHLGDVVAPVKPVVDLVVVELAARMPGLARGAELLGRGQIAEVGDEAPR